ncbi:GGDEF domain-containing protein [Nocardiopsis terrae]|uniref:Diguanylate cyclase (GGDEF)-like protein n=1 Tax=Nocardiopsis terrae TaxID=372655 RepID=A0ABR9HDW8_9ACTN|nr:GGDEF domain-containing protein [Nocardiopsis terrae]MBE1456990.1 diguanylate cyclase (GGDEF)-like protein [Nocardiopsis terrae]GHC89994.1 GGDEF domain-containing protein [Nocardiopsis terrae]
MSISEKPMAAEERRPGDRRTWPIFQQPLGLVVYLLLLVFVALFLFGVAAAQTALTVLDLTLFFALVVSAVVCVEAIRRIDMPAGLTRDLLGAWWFPAMLLLPPVYSLLIPVPVYLLLQRRSRRTLPHRRVFNAASVGVSGFLASVVWHGTEVGLLAGIGGSPAAHQVLTTVNGVFVALACCAGFTLMNTFLVFMGAGLSGGSGGIRSMWDREAFLVDSVELCVGVTVAILGQISLFLLVIAVPPVLLLQRSLVYQQLQAAARTDPKTGLLNAPTWEQEAAAEIARTRSARGRAAVLIVDIDHFKRVNDNHGHLFGDQVLLGVATTIAQQLRQSDLLGRFGGEEFVVMLPGTDTTEAWQAAERLRSQVGRMEIAVDGVQVSITISVGVAVVGDHGNDLVELLTAADLALYRAKETGRDRVCLPVGRPEVSGKIPGPRGGEIPDSAGSPGEPS